MNSPARSSSSSGNTTSAAASNRSRTVLVTGGGRGIGATVARTFASAGHRVVVASRTANEIEELAENLRDEGGLAIALTCDVQKPEDVTRLTAAAVSEFGPIEVLINNAGIGHAAPLHKTTLADWNRVFAVNATGTFLCLQACLPEMLTSGWGRVVNVASVAGLAGGRYISAYSASKHAVLGLTRSAAAEVVGRGVTINAICPGYVDTPMTRDTIENLQSRSGMSEAEALAAILETTRQPRLIAPEEVASSVYYLCGESAASIHGQSIVIDGGGMQS